MQFTVPGDDEVYDLVVGDVTIGEAKAMEKVTGLTMSQIGSLGENEQPTVVMQAMFWVSMKRKNPTLAFVELEDMPLNGIEFMAEDADEQESLDEGDPVGPTSPAPEGVGDHEATTSSLTAVAI